MNDKQTERRQEILMAALKAFTTKGFDKTSMDDIVRISGLSKGTLYWHFENKKALYAALIDFTMQGLIVAFDGIMESTAGLDALSALQAMFDGTVAMFEDDPDYPALTIDFMLQTLHDEKVKQQYLHYFVKYIERLAQVIEQGIAEGHFRAVDPMKAAIGIIATLDGLTISAVFKDDFQMITDEAWSMGAIISVASDLIINGLRKDE